MTTEKVIYFLKSYRLSNEHLTANYLAMCCDVSERQLRKLVEQIRNENLADGFVLCSDESGYWLSNNADEINSFLHRYLGAAFSQIKTAQVAKKFLSEQQTKDIQMELKF